MRTHPKTIILAFAGILVLGLHGEARSAPKMQETVELLMQICVGKSTFEKLETSGKGDVALTLQKLKSLGDFGVSGGASATFTKEQWVGLSGGISKELTAVQADQADKVRECLKPYMAGIVKAILETSK